VARRPRAGSSIDRAAALRSLIQDGIVTAAALGARDDLVRATMSMQRLGSLTSGMWRALSRELLTATERLDRQAEEHLDDVYRRAQALEVAPDAVLAVGVAAGHLDEHHETLDNLLDKADEAVRRLAAPEVLLGFSVDDAVLLDDDEEEAEEGEVETCGQDDEEAEDHAGDAFPGLGIDVWLFLWPAPLSPARVRILPEIAAPSNGEEPEVSVSSDVIADDVLVEALNTSGGLPREDVFPTLSALALACWSAHQADERGEADDDAEDEDDADE
jgi:hypothetical protein